MNPHDDSSAGGPDSAPDSTAEASRDDANDPKQIASSSDADTASPPPPSTPSSEASRDESSGAKEAGQDTPSDEPPRAEGVSQESPSEALRSQEPPSEETAEVSETEQSASSGDERGEAKPASKRSRRRRGDKGRAGGAPQQRQGEDVSEELARLHELSTRYPEIGAPLAKLAMKLGHQGLSERVLRMQLDQEIEARGVEYYRVAAELARKEGRSEEALEQVATGLKRVIERGDAVFNDERTRVLHLIRFGFAVLLFDREDLRSDPGFTQLLVEQLPKLSSHYDEDPFYHALLAQALWFEDTERSEQEWERAVALQDAETTWNARGTWYKEADKDLSRAEWAYRNGLKALPTSALLRHNLAQVLMDRAQHEGAELEQIRSWLNESEALLRQALRGARRHASRRHINGNIERVRALQAELPKLEQPPEPPPPEVGDLVRGRVRSFKPYGVFVSLGKRHSGLLHISEIAHEHIREPGDVLKIGQSLELKVLSVEPRDNGKGLRISLSRKATLPRPGASDSSSQPSSSTSPSNEPRGEGSSSSSTRPRERRGGSGNAPGASRRGLNQGRSQRASSSSSSSGRNQRDSGQDQRGSDQGIGSLGEMLLAKLEEKQNK